ncbi:MAG: hypothetical protein H0W33_08665 [Gammaproteobacteria bacterium]|nr:hypothetical protein [Gammaproteobacteria bacterium]
MTALLGMLAWSHAVWAQTEIESPFVVDRDKVLESTHVIAIASVLTDPQIDRDDSADQYAALVAEQLRQSGYTVIPSEAYTEILDMMIDQAGGIYDPVTGKRDDEKHSLVTKLAKREFRLQHDFDAILRPAILKHAVRYSGGEASWRGITEAGSKNSAAGRFWLGPGAGFLDALSFIARLEDPDGELWYASAGGIGLLQLYDGTSKVVVPVDELLGDTARGARAVRIALGDLLDAKADSGDLASNGQNAPGAIQTSAGFREDK